jgi:leucyl aminopeptidase (aminopeptidase T)
MERQAFRPAGTLGLKLSSRTRFNRRADSGLRRTCEKQVARRPEQLLVMTILDADISLSEGIYLIQPVLTDLSKLSFDPELSPGAHNAVYTCLRIQPAEKVTLITDNECREIAASIAAELKALGAPFKAFVLEDLAPRPLTELPREIAEDMETSDVSIFAVKVQRNELKSRMQMTDIVNRRKMRHAHMVNINRQIMLEGMRADYNKVDAISRKAMEIVTNAKEIRCTNPAGSDFTAKLNPNYHWLKTSGIISRDKWGNLPGGEIFTTPGEVNGICVVDGVVGDYLCEKYQDLARQPLTIEMKNNRITRVSSENKELEQEFWAYTHTDENSDLVGEFAIGTNIELTHVIGQILQDEKFPGIHIAFGNPYGEHTGANWYSATHIDVVGTQFNIWVDGRQIMEKGRFLIEA